MKIDTYQFKKTNRLYPAIANICTQLKADFVLKTHWNEHENLLDIKIGIESTFMFIESIIPFNDFILLKFQVKEQIEMYFLLGNKVCSFILSNSAIKQEDYDDYIKMILRALELLAIRVNFSTNTNFFLRDRTHYDYGVVKHDLRKINLDFSSINLKAEVEKLQYNLYNGNIEIANLASVDRYVILSILQIIKEKQSVFQLNKVLLEDYKLLLEINGANDSTLHNLRETVSKEIVLYQKPKEYYTFALIDSHKNYDSDYTGFMWHLYMLGLLSDYKELPSLKRRGVKKK